MREYDGLFEEEKESILLKRLKKSRVLVIFVSIIGFCVVFKIMGSTTSEKGRVIQLKNISYNKIGTKEGLPYGTYFLTKKDNVWYAVNKETGEEYPLHKEGIERSKVPLKVDNGQLGKIKVVKVDEDGELLEDVDAR